MNPTKEAVQQVLFRLDRGWSHPAWDYPTDKIHKLLSALYAHPAILESTCSGCEEIQNAIDAIATDLLEFSFNEENFVDDEIDDEYDSRLDFQTGTKG